MKVVAAGRVLSRAAPGKHGGNVRLVRRLVLAEPGVAVDTKDRLRRIGDIERREIGERLHHGRYKFHHGGLYLGLEDLLARLKPFAIVVLLQGPQEGDALGRESGKARGLAGYSYFMYSDCGR